MIDIDNFPFDEVKKEDNVLLAVLKYVLKERKSEGLKCSRDEMILVRKIIHVYQELKIINNSIQIDGNEWGYRGFIYSISIDDDVVYSIDDDEVMVCWLL